ncbi:hypothetical protein AB0D27_11360 [Streptomyces sp. NPDC048415]|uniref:hypothetical protein n=1 Tax=Streptomyces sp. NPDC048415 TaxID=3154822 RepID=UPI0034412EFF
MKYYLRALAAWITGDLPPRCHACHRFVFGGWQSERVNGETRLWHLTCDPEKEAG